MSAAPGQQDRAGTARPRSARGAWSLRTRVFVVVGLSAVPAVLGAVVGTAALAGVNAKVHELDHRSVRTLVALADLRDMEGDMRVEIHDLIAAAPRDRPDVLAEFPETDAEADADLAAFLRDHASRTDASGVDAERFIAKLAEWRKVRDEQVAVPALAGRDEQARAALTGPLQEADDAMAAPLDDLFEKESQAADTRVAAAQHAYEQARIWVSLLIGVGVAVSALVAWLLIRRPVALLGRITSVVSRGDLSERVGVADPTDVGRLGQAVDQLLDTLEEQRTSIAAQTAARERQLAGNFARQQLAEREVRERAQAIIDETGTAVLAELQGVLDQTDTVRSAFGEIDARIKEADAMTQSVVDRAGGADQVVDAVGESLRRVAGIAHLIAGVAEQTNLLALNATIEAARAGEAGRGFSVVANEVAELAAETGRSTGEISTTVSALESDASAMAATIQEMSRGVSTMSEATLRVSDVATRQREAVERLDGSLQEAIARIQAMSQLTGRLERRIANRVRVNAQGVLWRSGGRSEDCEIIDLSVTGVRVWLDHQLPDVGDIVTLEMDMGGVTTQLRGSVVRVQDGNPAHEMAATFVGLDAATKDRLSSYLGSLTTT
jgi:methyl-accepting chemotaxis protein